MAYALNPKTRQALNRYMSHIASMNGAESFSTPFEVVPAKEQKLIDQYSLQTDFLGRINIQGVKMGHGEKLGLGQNKSVASTTDTRIQPRRPTGLFDLEGIDEYLCTQTDYDIAIDWRVIDNWGYLPDFQTRLANLAVKTIAQDMQRCGFNGTHRVKTSNRELYPNLEDVNIGWLEKIRQHNAERHINGITVGAAHEFKNMDALAEMVVHELIGEQHRQAGDLVAITSTGLVTDKYLNLINQDHAPTEQHAANALYMKKNLGTLAVDTPNFFVPNGLLITSYDNLSIYQQRGTLRRYFRDEPEWNRTTDYRSVNECFVVEDYTKVAFIENIQLEK